MAWKTVVLWFCSALCVVLPSVDIPEDYIPMGPPGLMRRLDKAEMEYLRNLCKYDNIITNKTLQSRIIGGEYVPSGHANMPTAAIMNSDHSFRCAATFITGRHLLTAAHCFHQDKFRDADPPFLAVGGVCLGKGEMCTEGDVGTREIDFVIYDLESGVDLAIIQLRKDQDQFNKIEQYPACLYGPWADNYEVLPETVSIVGWGQYSPDKPDVSDKQKVAEFSIVRPDDGPTVDPKSCNGQRFCVYSPDKTTRTGPGDSGDTVYTFDGGRYFMLGVHSRRGASTHRWYGVETDVRPFLNDFCRLLGLCVAGRKWDESVPVLKWNSVYYAQGPNTVEVPFPVVSVEYRDEMQAYCVKQRKPGKRRSEALPASVHMTWAAHLVDPETNKVVCQATIISNIHVITHKKCFEDAKKSGKYLRLFGGDKCRANTPNCPREDGGPKLTKLQYEMIAWSDADDNDLAIIFLRTDLKSPKFGDVERFRAACLPRPEDEPPPRMIIYGFAPHGGDDQANTLHYGNVTAKTGVDCPVGPGRICVAPAMFVDPYVSTEPDRGGGILDPLHNTVFGMFVSRNGQSPTMIAADLRAYLEDICFYTGRCDHRYNAKQRSLQNIRVYNQHQTNWSPEFRRGRRHRQRQHRRRQHRKAH
ncbi:trypsin [Aphelenchoides avenae]|nr:trypsin [Aphelenchus avenae]